MSLELGFAEVDPTSAQVDAIIDTFESYVDAGNELRAVVLQNAAINDTQFTTLFNNVLRPSSSTLDDLSIGGWDNRGSLSDAILSYLRALMELLGLQIRNQEPTTLDELESLTALDYLEEAGGNPRGGHTGGVARCCPGVIGGGAGCRLFPCHFINL